MSSSPMDIQRYVGKISGSLLDQINIHIEVTPVPFEKLSENHKGEASKVIHERVIKAREIQTERFKESEILHCNTQINTKQIRLYCNLDKKALDVLKNAMECLNLSARAYDCILKIAKLLPIYETNPIFCPIILRKLFNTEV